MNSIDTIYSKAFSEVLQILKYISKEDYEKIPLEVIELMEDNSCKDYTIEYNPNQSLTEQNFSKEAKTIIAIFFRDYWATEKQKEKILAKEKYDDYLEEIEKQKEFDINVFKNKSNKNREEKQQENNQLIVWEEKNNILRKIFLKIKEIFQQKTKK